MTTAQKEAETLMNSLLPVARRMLASHGEFYPYGGTMGPDGQITHVDGQIHGTDHPKSQHIINLLRATFKQDAQSGKFKAVAIVFDVRITPPGETKKVDAIQVCLDHQNGYSAEVLFPYFITDGKLLYGKTFAQRGDGLIFPRNEK